MLSFLGQREGEEVITVIRKHTIVYVKLILAFILLIIFPLALFLLFWFKVYPLADYYQRGVIAIIFMCLVFLYSLLFFCMRWINEEFDVFILTTERLIDVTQISFFNRSVTSTPLEHIQDTTGIIKGFLPTILQYGDLTVQTAGSKAADIFIDRIRDPEGAARLILDWAHKKRPSKSAGQPVTT